MNIEIANRLVNLRKQNNLSQEALAEKLGISRQAVSKWERAEASPDTDNLILLARLYGVSLDELLRTENEIPMPEDRTEEAWQGENFTDSPTDEQCNDYQKYDEYSKYDKYENVHIGKDGIHVSEENKQVYIDWQGIHVNEGDGKNVDVGLYFPVGLLVCIAYLVVGIVWKAWHPGWLLLFLIPVLETLIKAVHRRDAAVSVDMFSGMMEKRTAYSLQGTDTIWIRGCSQDIRFLHGSTQEELEIKEIMWADANGIQAQQKGNALCLYADRDKNTFFHRGHLAITESEQIELKLPEAFQGQIYAETFSGDV